MDLRNSLNLVYLYLHVSENLNQIGSHKKAMYLLAYVKARGKLGLGLDLIQRRQPIALHCSRFFPLPWVKSSALDWQKNNSYHASLTPLPFPCLPLKSRQVFFSQKYPSLKSPSTSHLPKLEYGQILGPTALAKEMACQFRPGILKQMLMLATE